MNEFQTIALAVAFFSPLSWAIALLSEGLGKQKSKSYLFFLMLAATFTYMMTYAKFSGYINYYSFLFPLQASVTLTLFPLFYLYVFSLTADTPIIQNRFRLIYIHFLFPVFIFLFYFILQKFLMSRNEEVRFVMHLLDMTESENSLFSTGKLVYNAGRFFMVILSIIYIILSSVKLVQHYRRFNHTFPDNSSKSLNWIKTLFVFTFIMLVFFTIIHVMNNQKVAADPLLITLSYLSFAAFFWFLGLNGFKQTQIYHSEIVLITGKFQDHKLTKSEFDEFINEYKPQRKINVSVYDFCMFFQVNCQYLTHFLREEYGLNFRAVINTYRIDDVIEMIQESTMRNEQPDLKSISLKAGFESFTTFKKVFKSQKGVHPAQYCKKYLEKANRC
jgi:AraC-like DNA-binding protein